ncbi:Rv2231c family pyridoxal phosphate-dependent protein CobC [Corynebacterium sp. ES2730-CONJ]|uniref:Rv2231c family pyridoxal phosphate-dependent protein CobC n=1 Tax=Corynebacterium sp. ES2730-CONJ TaxID=2973941 RepID=UPI00216AE384|nr:Rv2231c family pyridoxal phosphate-dependent protein CobC [Corynebacterium sp. ES2730-CONJ]MCS4532417.1 Rv2231c family pyridoxal phosphate-dependent protein CobC [Corynebacterium sp. ES2730-CONJ]
MLSRTHGDTDALGAHLDFAVNVTGPPPPWLRTALIDALGEIHRYPAAPEVAKVEELIADYHQVPPDHILLISGASEGFAMLPHLKPAHPAVIHPGFCEPELMLIDAGYTPEQLIVDPPFDQLPEIPDHIDMVIIGNPTNPTGQVLTPAQLATLRKPGRTLVVDEAFLDCVSEEYSMVGAIAAAGPGRVIVARSLTKTWGLAGLRVGYLIADPATLRELCRRRAHWPVSSLAIAAARAVFEIGIPQGHLELARAEMSARRTAMIPQLEAAGLTIASNSSAPFLLVRGGNEQLRRRLRLRGIAIRGCESFPGLDQGYWRLALRDSSEVEKLIGAFREEVLLDTNPSSAPRGHSWFA